MSRCSLRLSYSSIIEVLFPTSVAYWNTEGRGGGVP